MTCRMSIFALASSACVAPFVGISLKHEEIRYKNSLRFVPHLSNIAISCIYTACVVLYLSNNGPDDGSTQTQMMAAHRPRLMAAHRPR